MTDDQSRFRVSFFCALFAAFSPAAVRGGSLGDLSLPVPGPMLSRLPSSRSRSAVFPVCRRPVSGPCVGRLQEEPANIGFRYGLPFFELPVRHGCRMSVMSAAPLVRRRVAMQLTLSRTREPQAALSLLPVSILRIVCYCRPAPQCRSAGV